MHGHQFGAAFLINGQLPSGCQSGHYKKKGANLICASNTPKNGAPSLARLVPGRNWLSGQGANRGVLDIKVVDAWGGLLEEFSAAVA